LIQTQEQIVRLFQSRIKNSNSLPGDLVIWLHLSNQLRSPPAGLDWWWQSHIV